MDSQQAFSPSSSVDPREVEYYARFAETWWDTAGPFWPLHRLNEIRVPFIATEVCRQFGRDPACARPLAGLKVLDIGCGGGILAESMAGLGAAVTGIDVVERNIAIARLHAEQAGLDIEYGQITVEALAGLGLDFDVVLNMEVVEHVADLEGFMKSSCRLVRAGGLMFVATINRTVLAWLIAIVGAEYVLRWMPRGTHRWRWFRRPAEIRALLEHRGLAVARSTGVAVNPFRKQLFLTPIQQVNYMLAAVRNGHTDCTRSPE